MGFRNIFSNSLIKCSVILSLVLIILPKTDIALDKFKRKNIKHNKGKKAKKIKVDPTIIYPDVLKGNEEQTIEYVKKFSEIKKHYIIRMYSDGKTMLPYAAAVLKKYHLPEEYKILLPLESEYDSNALSKAGAVGYWQLIDTVANEYGLSYTNQPSELTLKKIFRNPQQKQAYLTKFVAQKDDRKNFRKSTDVAAKHLVVCLRNSGRDVLLAAACYNYGIGNVRDVINKSKKKKPTFWDIKDKLPEETESYVMNFIALNVMFHNYEKYVKKKYVFPEKSCFESNQFNIANYP